MENDKIVVRLISQSGRKALVQFVDDGKPSRRIISIDDVYQSRVLKSVLDDGEVAGVDWSLVPDMTIDGETISKTLLKYSIFDEQDLEDPDKRRSALLQFGGLIYQHIKASLKE